MSENRDSLLEFPCEFAIKVMGRRQDDFEAQVIALLRGHFEENDILHTRQRDSASANYQALTITVMARDQAQLDAAYQDLNAAEQVLMTL